MPTQVFTNDVLLIVLGLKKAEFTAQNQLMFLYRNDFTPGPTSVLADFTPANYQGATGIAVQWDFAPFIGAPGLGVLQGQPCIFTPTGTGVTNNIYGFYIWSVRDSKVYIAQRFDDAPRSLGATLDPMTVVPKILDRAIPT